MGAGFEGNGLQMSDLGLNAEREGVEGGVKVKALSLGTEVGATITITNC